ncbi:MAG: major capsid protein [Paracoccus sp. (in: a-proteobacteria)]|uniref:major capsid protein n=1 Tax=Paracoccus sp. TaxID=267 RepID=UPI0026DF3EDB|nr:major capsid protein [Paracoccus sp. (in: a-proteobacteria)]MDO5614445.1 major capsid protein [Paracoccus sp. (in: a-proteobacteria)]
MNQRTAAVIDPILSTHARGYRNAELISHLLFPRVTIPNRSMRVLKFGKESFRLMNTRRSPGAAKARIQYGFDSDSISLVQDALEGFVPVEHQEEASKVPGVDLGRSAINMVLDIVDLGMEKEAADLARNAALYADSNKVTLTGSARWSDAASDPLADIDEAKDSIRRMIGRYPNMLTLGPSVIKALKRHPKIKEQFKYTTAASITTEMLAGYFDLEKIVVGKAVFLPETAPDTQPASDIWGDDAILSFTPSNAERYDIPSFAYTYELSGYPQVMRPYFEERTDSWVYPTKTERRPYLVGAESGFLFKDAGKK